MADYIVSARKYRPSTFKTVVGQKALVQTLKNAIASGKLAHAYLFCGPRGVGKTTCARIFAKTINCEHRTPDGEACNECESCQSFHEQRSYNVYELDAASNNSVDNIRELIDQVQIPPQIGKYKVFIIDEVHMLSTSAFNAFLKTLEEPPKHAIFVMCTTEKQKILPTILSRCQTYDFQRISTQDIVEQLTYIANQESIRVEPRALQVIARKADGGMRDALSVFDQITSFTSGNVTYEAVISNLNLLDSDTFFRITDDALQGNLPAALMMLDDTIRRGFDPQSFIGGWAGHLRDLMVAQDPSTLKLIEAGPEEARRYETQASRCQPYFLFNAVMIANECDFNYRNSRNKRLSVELAIVRICQLLHPVAQPPQPQRAPLQNVSSQTPRTPRTSQTPKATPQTPPQTPRTPQTSQTLPQTPPPSRTTVMTRGGSLAGRGGSMMPSLQRGAPTMSSSTAAPSAASQQPEMNEPVDEPALRRTWKQYIQTIPEEKLLQTAVQNSVLKLREDTHIDVTVGSDEQMQRINENKANLLGFLRQQLRNTRLDLSITVNQAAAPKIPLTPRERLTEIREGHTELIDEIINNFGLELS